MSGSRRHRDSVSPSLFPFLAVLLCTMGALVLILMLVVAGAQADAQQTARQVEERFEEVESQLQLASYSHEKQLKQGQIQLEKKRLALQHLEQHIQELLAELEQLQRTAELAQSDMLSDKSADEARGREISELEQQLLDAKQELIKQKLEKPKGDKPIFAIIPYAGPNGTYRRPIYLECREDRLLIQPEGIALSAEDLQPPYGPGNPLDAALRIIRTQYVPANHAVTSTAYPLLVVRPSGIRTYTMARAAMSGWDDQFGYELIGEELELTFPEGDPGLKNKIVQALELARQRQAALVMAMPKMYRQFSDSEPLRGGNGNGLGGPGYGGGAGSGSASPSSGSRGGFAARGDMQPGDAFGENSPADALGGGGFGTTGIDAAGPEQHLADRDRLAAEQLRGSSPQGSYFGSATGEQASHLGFGDSSGNYNQNGSAQRDGAAGGDNSAAGSAQSGSDGSSGGRTSTENGSYAGSQGGSQMNLSGSQMEMPGQNPLAGSANSSTGSQGTASQNTSPNQATTSQATASSATSSASAGDSNSAGPPNPSLQFDATRRQESTAPVASQRGRGWAWSKGPPTQTPVARAIRLQCLPDRWVVLPDSPSSREGPKEILFDVPPQARAEKLAKVIADRVDGWGLALSGGYWKPILEVEVAPGAGWRYDQLQQLLEGSGLEVHQRP